MSTADTSTEIPKAGTADMKLEVVTLPVSDVDRAKRELFHLDGTQVLPGPDPQRGSYLTYASFSDPDGNGWLLQEITTRLPGREWED
jgi:hypothetical protein